MKTSTNALTARYCAMKGWPSQTVQTFYGGKRHDLFGIADTIVQHPTALLWVQNCSYGTLKAHRDEINKSKYLDYLRSHEVWIQLWEWRKKKVGLRGMWFMRMQSGATIKSEGITIMARGWDPVSNWIGPLDLYPKKT